MAYIIKTFLLIVLVVTLQANTHTHILHKFEKEFQNLAHSYQHKDTSSAFSIAMKIFTSVQMFMEETNMPEQN